MGKSLAGVLMIDVRTGLFRFVAARAVLLATGGGPTMYRYHTPSGDKSMDGLAMALRLGLPLRDMEMVQFHPTGLLAGPDTRMTGTVLEEGLRGSGGHLLNGSGERFMATRDARAERATRDFVSRCIYEEMRAGRTTRNGGVHIKMSHLGPERVRKEFKGMVERCADCGFDLAGGLVEVVPTAHYFMGGVVCGVDTSTELPGLFVAGEDAGGAHGANRLGGNGVANSTVFGGIAGETMAAWLARNPGARAADEDVLGAEMARAQHPFARKGGDLNGLRERLLDTMWDDVGVLRDAVGLKRGLEKVSRDRRRAAVDRRGRRRPRLQPHLARLAEPALAGRDLQGDCAGGAAAREQPRRALSRGLPRRGRPRHLDVHGGAAERRGARHRRRAGAVHPRSAGREPAEGGRGMMMRPFGASGELDPGDKPRDDNVGCLGRQSRRGHPGIYCRDPAFSERP